MNQAGTCGLNWWHIPYRAPAAPRKTVAGIIGGLRYGLIYGIGIIIFSIPISAFITTAIGGSHRLGRINPDHSSPESLTTSWRRNRNYGLALMVVDGIVYGAMGWVVGGGMSNIKAGLAGGVAYGLAHGLRANPAFPVWLTSVQLAMKWRTPCA
jgi:hypothetical protein